jgi:N-acetylneuraminate lyase
MIDDPASWRGIYAATLTPLDEDESLDEEACAALVDRLLSEGQAGLYLTGGTGEEYAIDDEVRIALYPVAVRAARGRGRTIAHVGGTPTRRALRMLRAACDAGVDAVAAIAPHGGRYEFDELLAYYRKLAAESAVPLLGYHIPHVTGYDLSLDELSGLVELPNVAGLKFTCSDFMLLERLGDRHPEKLFFAGKDEMLLSGLAAGAHGGIGTSYNLLGALAVELVRRFDAGDLPGALQCQRGINGYIEALRRCPNNLRAVKLLAAEEFGWAAAVSPAPGEMPPGESIEPMRRALRAAREAAAASSSVA